MWTRFLPGLCCNTSTFFSHPTRESFWHEVLHVRTAISLSLSILYLVRYISPCPYIGLSSSTALLGAFIKSFLWSCLPTWNKAQSTLLTELRMVDRLRQNPHVRVLDKLTVGLSYSRNSLPLFFFLQTRFYCRAYRSPQPVVSWPRLIHLTSSNSEFHFNSILTSAPWFRVVYSLQVFQLKFCMIFLPFLCMLHAP